MMRAGTPVGSSDAKVRWASLLGSGALVRAGNVRDRSDSWRRFRPTAVPDSSLSRSRQ